jgi:hypothetical protein
VDVQDMIKLALSRRERRELERVGREFTKHSAAIMLLSPELRPDVKALLGHVEGVDLGAWTTDWFEQLVKLGDKVVESMQRSLGIKPLALPDRPSYEWKEGIKMHGIPSLF